MKLINEMYINLYHNLPKKDAIRKFNKFLLPIQAYSYAKFRDRLSLEEFMKKEKEWFDKNGYF